MLQQIIAYLRQHPGASTLDLSLGLGAETSAMERMLEDLFRRGRVRRREEKPVGCGGCARSGCGGITRWELAPRSRDGAPP